MLPPPLIPDKSNGKEELNFVRILGDASVSNNFLSISEVACHCFKPVCSCLTPKNGVQHSTNYYSDSVNQTQYAPSSASENYWMPNRYNNQSSTTFSYTSDDMLLSNPSEFINFEPNTDVYKMSPLSGEVFQPDEIFQLDQPIRYPNNGFNATSPQTLLDLGSGTIETKVSVSAHGFNEASDSFYNSNEDSTSSSQNNDSSICGYANYHNNNNVVVNEMGNNRIGGTSDLTSLSSCNGNTVQMQHYENSFHIQYEHQAVVNFKTNRGKYDDVVVNDGYRKTYDLYDENQTFLGTGSEVAAEKIHQQLNGSDLSLGYQHQQFMEPCFSYGSNDIDSNVTYKIALDSGQ